MRAGIRCGKLSVLAFAAGTFVVSNVLSPGGVQAQGAANLAGQATAGSATLSPQPGSNADTSNRVVSGGAKPTGVWVDHTGRGAVEISECGARLCGRIVWVNDPENSKSCGLEILGDVQSVGPRRWDNGWILDPDYGQKYDVELTPLEDGRLQVLGYAGIKALSETMIWNKAPETLVRCDASPDFSLAGAAGR